MGSQAPRPVVTLSALDCSSSRGAMNAAATVPAVDTLAELLERLGSISPARVRVHPPPGTATQQDVLACDAGEKRLCDVRKPT